ncbi:MAG TPA: hypothetical protein PLP19_18690 [bacterium]|nr:hypothetical protein [bacterium]HPN45527.1 hypothetical protein [bacterium]
MHKILDKLIELQDVDIQLKELAEARGDLPQRVNELKMQVEKTKSDLAFKKQEKKDKQSRKFAIDGNTSLLKEKLKKYQNQLYQVKNNKEYDAITLEIENCKKEIDALEYESLELDEATNSIDQQIGELEKMLETLVQETQENEKILNEMLAKTEQQENILKDKRTEITRDINRPLLNTYDRIRLNRGGRALSYLTHGSCNECSSRIPPQRGMEIRMMDKLFFCEVCGRILVWRQEESVANTQVGNE